VQIHIYIYIYIYTHMYEVITLKKEADERKIRNYGCMNVGIIWDNYRVVRRRFGGNYRLHLQGLKSSEQETSVQYLAR
jgi:hypothetical protein